MTTAIKRRRGTTTQHSTFTGLEGEITVDTTKDTVVVHDGSTAGGYPLLREDLSNNTNVVTTTNTKTLTNKTFGDNPTFSAGTANGVAYLNGSKVLTTVSALTFDGVLTSPKYVATSAGNDRLLIEPQAAGSGTLLVGTNNAGSAYAPLVLDGGGIRFNSSGSEQMRLTTTGLGIGTSSVNGKLNVATSGGKGFEFYPDNTSGTNLVLNYDRTGAVYQNYAVRAASHQWLIGATEQMRLDSSGNLGLGVTPSNAYAGAKFLEFSGASIGATSGAIYIPQNAYLNASGNWTYKATSVASLYQQDSGIHRWYTAPSGTAGNAITFTQAMTLDAGGRLMVGTTTATDANALFTVSNGTVILENYLSTAGSTGYAGTRSNHAYGLITNGNERMRITSAGYVGIGTSTPIAALEVSGGALFGSSNGTVSGAYTVEMRTTTNWNYAGLNVIRNAANVATPRLIGLPLDGDSLSSTTIGAYNAIWGAYDSPPTTGSTSSALNGAMVYGAYAGHRWYNNGSERMRIDSSGNVGIGTSSPASKLNVSGGNVTVSPGYGIAYSADQNRIMTPEDNVYGALIRYASGAICRFVNGSTESMRIDSSGNLLVGTTSANERLVVVGTANNYTISCRAANTSGTYYQMAFVANSSSVGAITSTTTATTYATSSDYRLKENIQPMQNALGVVAQLNPVTYTWKADGSDGQGFIAHELQAVVPDCVTGEKDAVDAEGKPVYQGIDTSFLVATLAAAIKELKAELDATKAEVAALKAAN